MTKNFNINWGLIGCNLTAERIAHSLHSLPRHIGAVADKNYLQAIKFAQAQMIMQALPISNLLADQQLDAIFLAGELSQQLPAAKAALAKHKSLLIDRFDGLQLADWQKLICLAHEKKQLVWPNLPTAWMPLLKLAAAKASNLQRLEIFFAPETDLTAFIPTTIALLAGLKLPLTKLRLAWSRPEQIKLLLNGILIEIKVTRQTDLIENALLTASQTKFLLTSVIAPVKIQPYPLSSKSKSCQQAGASQKAEQYLLRAFEAHLTQPEIDKSPHLIETCLRILQELRCK